MKHKQNGPGALAGATRAGNRINAVLNATEDTNPAMVEQRLAVAADHARAKWLMAAVKLTEAADHTAARHELRELRLFARELGIAASAAASEGRAA